MIVVIWPNGTGKRLGKVLEIEREVVEDDRPGLGDIVTVQYNNGTRFRDYMRYPWYFSAKDPKSPKYGSRPRKRGFASFAQEGESRWSSRKRAQPEFFVAEPARCRAPIKKKKKKRRVTIRVNGIQPMDRDENEMLDVVSRGGASLESDDVEDEEEEEVEVEVDVEEGEEDVEIVQLDDSCVFEITATATKPVAIPLAIPLATAVVAPILPVSSTTIRPGISPVAIANALLSTPSTVSPMVDSSELTSWERSGLKSVTEVPLLSKAMNEMNTELEWLGRIRSTVSGLFD